MKVFKTKIKSVFTVLIITLFSTAAIAENKHVVIVGGGISGLGAAHKLTSSGYDVTILEAKDKLGGRLDVVDMGGVAVDTSSDWHVVHKSNPLHKYFKNNPKVKTIDLDDEDYYDANGTKLSRSKYKKLSNLIDDVIWKHTGKLKSHKIPTIGKLYDEILEERSKKVKKDHIYAYFKIVFTGESLNSDFYDIPVGTLNDGWDGSLGIPYIKEAKVPGRAVKGLDEDNYLIVMGGYGLIVDDIIKDIKSNKGKLTVINKAKVTGIDYSDKSNVIVKYNNSGEEKSISSNKVISTLPLGVMQHIVKNDSQFFMPEYPKDKKDNLLKIKNGLNSKVIFKFNNKFWKDEFEFTVFRPKGQKQFDWYNYEYSGRSVLVANLYGKDADISKMSDAQIVQLAMKDLRAMYKSVPSPAKTKVTRWGEDEFTRGSWAAYSMNLRNSDMRYKVAEPLNDNLYFAGEHIAYYFSTPHGSYISGLQVAEDVIKGY